METKGTKISAEDSDNSDDSMEGERSKFSAEERELPCDLLMNSNEFIKLYKEHNGNLQGIIEHLKQRMANIKEQLLFTINDLESEKLELFQWHLKNSVEGLPVIPKAQLENANRLITVDEMVQTYGSDGAVEVTLAILKKMNHNQQAEELRTKMREAPSQQAARERAQKQSDLKEVHRKFQQRIQEREKKVQDLKQAVDTLKRSAQAAVEDSERIFTDLIHSIETKRCEVRELIRAQEKEELSRAEGLLEQLEQEIVDLKRRDTELEQPSHTEDHIYFLRSFQSLRVSSRSEDSPNIPVIQHPSFDGVKKFLSDLKERLEEFCKEEFDKIPPQVNPDSGLRGDPPQKGSKRTRAAAVQRILPPEPKTREDFLKYYRRLTLDPNTAHRRLILSEMNRVVTCSRKVQSHTDRPERFDHWRQVLSKESVCGRCYWEVEWRGGRCVNISVSYKNISRKGRGDDCRFGFNSQSWSLVCSRSLAFYHNNSETQIQGPPPSRIGVYVDHSAGTLSFYRVSDTMTLLHTVHTTFTHTLYAGFNNELDSTLRLCDLE